MTSGARRSLVNWLRRALTIVGAVPLVALAVTLFLASTLWVGDMLTFFLPWIGVGALGVGAVAVVLRFRFVAGAAGLLAAAVLIPMIAATHSAPGEPQSGNLLRVTTFNTLGGTADAELLRSFLESEQPDLLVLQEYSTSLDRQLLPDTMFAYRSDEGVSNLQPVVLFSRFPILDVSAVPPAGSVRGQGITRIALSVDGLEVILFAVHATTPRRGERDWLERNAILDALGNRIAEEPEGTIVIAAGDFNTPPWSPYFRHLAATGSVTATSGAFLPPATRIIDRGWLPALFGSPVDHILVSENIAWAPHRVGPNLGSDHRPVTADLYLQAN